MSKTAYIFPGQGAQFAGMGKDLFESNAKAKEYFLKANKILGFDITEIMFNGTADELKQTKVTQPAIFLHSVITVLSGETTNPDMVAGHSLGEFSALVVNSCLAFEDALKLVYQRAIAMQDACERIEGIMAAVLGLENKIVEDICKNTSGIVVAANYNCPGQLVISGELSAVENACEALKEAGARRALMLPVGGAFHSPLMEPAKENLEKAILSTKFNKPTCPIYQNVTANAVSEPNEIRDNLIAQLTSPVRWTQSMEQMITDGADNFIEAGPGKVLQGLMRKINRDVTAASY